MCIIDSRKVVNLNIRNNKSFLNKKNKKEMKFKDIMKLIWDKTMNHKNCNKRSIKVSNIGDEFLSQTEFTD